MTPCLCQIYHCCRSSVVLFQQHLHRLFHHHHLLLLAGTTARAATRSDSRAKRQAAHHPLRLPPARHLPPAHVCHLTLHLGGLRENKERPRLTGLSKEIVETGPWLIEGGKPTDRLHFFRRGVAWSPWGGGTWSTTGERSVKLKLCAARRSTRALWPRASSGPSGSEASRGLRGSGGRPRREA